MFAIAAALFATSCAQDGLDGSAVKGEEAVVTFAVNAPQIAGTRTFGDGKTANDLYYAVYNESNEVIEAISKMDTPEAINISAQVKLRLVNGNTYSLIFWAENAAGVATIDWDAQTLTYAPTASSVEEYDAFWAYVEPFTVNGAATKNVDLYRPFAQVIIGAADYEAAVAAGLTATETQITVTTPSVMSLVNGATSVPVEHTYAYAALPNEAFPIANHKHMGMNYLLFGADKGMVDIKFEYKGSGAEYSRNMPAVPVQRNYRTIVYGNLLTSQTDFNVTIDDAFLKDDKYGQIDGVNYIKVDNSEELAAAFADNQLGIIILNDNIVVNQSLSRAGGDATMTVSADKKLVIDLNGKKMSATSSQTGKNYNMFDVRGNLTVKNGTIEYQHTGDNMGWNNFAEIFYVGFNGTLNLDGVTAKNLGGSDMAYVIDMVNATNITVNVENSKLETPYIPIRVFNNNKTGVHNVTIKNSELKGKYCFWVQYWLAEGRDQETLDKTLKLDIYNSQVGANNNNTFTFNNNYDAPVLYGYNEAVYFDQYGQEIVLYTPIEGAEGVALDQDSNYVIIADEGLASISALIAADVDGFAGKTILLDVDVDLEGVEFAPIGYNPADGTAIQFKGTFDGQGNAIKNLNQQDLNGGYTQSVGLFASIADATIKNLVIEDIVAAKYGAEAGAIASIATGDCTFEGIEVKSGSIVAYNNDASAIVGWANVGNFTFKDITIGSDVTVHSLWNSYDTSVGGVIGTLKSGSTATFENITIACKLDVYNDVCSNYQYGAYRRAGMLIGNMSETQSIDGTTHPNPSAAGVTCKNVTVIYGDWMNYHYCEYKSNGHGSYDDEFTWKCSRVEGSDWGSDAIDTTQCNHESFESHNMCMPVDQLFGGGQGVYGLAEYPGVTVNYPASYTPEN